MAKILVVDDEITIVRSFAVFLAEEGHEVITACDYREALERLSETDADLILADIVLGGRTGIDLLREVKARGHTCPVVMITGYPDVRTASEAVRLGAFDYVAKPVVQEKLLQLTNVALRHKKALDEREQYRLLLEAIFRSVDDAIITIDSDQRIMDMNAAAKALCGAGPGLPGGSLCGLELPCREGILGAVRETLDGQGAVRGRRLEHPCEGRYPLVLTVSTYPLISFNGDFLGAVLVVRDDSRIAGLEQQLEERRRFHNLVGKSAPMQKVYSLIESLAGVDTTVLITGESGTGKELVAAALHHLGGRGAGVFVKVNCSALPETLLQSELFGHVKGAFTGAVTDRIGRFQAADGGTILLDEIGDITKPVQVSLLRVLQERQFERVGDSRPVRVDVRVIASTNQDLGEMVEHGDFREDLYYRLRVVEISLPPLRDRREDIPLLIEHFIGKFNGKFNKTIRSVSQEVESLFVDHPWNGNVRELEHALEHAFVVCRQDVICSDHLPPWFAESRHSESAVLPLGDGLSAEAIREALRKAGWNKAKAARLLGVDRKTLYRNMAKHGIREET